MRALTVQDEKKKKEKQFRGECGGGGRCELRQVWEFAKTKMMKKQYVAVDGVLCRSEPCRST